MSTTVLFPPHSPRIRVPRVSGTVLPFLFYGVGGLLLFLGAPVGAFFYTLGCLMNEDTSSWSYRTIWTVLLSSQIVLLCVAVMVWQWTSLAVWMVVMLSLPYILFSTIAVIAAGVLAWSMDKNDHKDKEFE